MARKYINGTYQVENTAKYKGKGAPTYRSSWELRVFRVLDLHPSVLEWASEPFPIPYLNPTTNGISNYYPDLLVIYESGSTGKRKADLIEIKPKKEALLEYAKSKRDKIAFAVNQAKWQAAEAWCKKKGLNFKIMTEDDLFMRNGKKL